MQTFITANAWTFPGMTLPEEEGALVPADVCKSTAAVLDTPRLGKQRVEAKQIYTSLETGAGWIHHPATKMWANHLGALAAYGWYMCQEWKRRGFEDTLQGWFIDRCDVPGEEDNWPWWFGHPEMVESHRSKLLRKLPSYYETLIGDGGLWTDEQYALFMPLPYLWPNGVNDLVPQGFYLSGAEYKRKDWEVPAHWIVKEDRRVEFRA